MKTNKLGEHTTMTRTRLTKSELILAELVDYNEDLPIDLIEKFLDENSSNQRSSVDEIVDLFYSTYCGSFDSFEEFAEMYQDTFFDSYTYDPSTDGSKQEHFRKSEGKIYTINGKGYYFCNMGYCE